MLTPEYFDHNATTPLDPVVFEAMRPYLCESFGNASSRHEFGRAARRAVDAAREQVAAALGAHPTEVVFTGGGSESNNLFLKGAADRLPAGRVLIGATEHPSVLRPAQQLQRQGWQVGLIPVDAAGRIDLQEPDWAGPATPTLVSCMLANNETGVVTPLAPLVEAAKRARAWVHCDAVQALGKLPVDFRSLGVHGLSVSGHKIYGPKGVGALVFDKRVDLEPLIAGGGHERGLRAGTENVAAIVGFGLACERAVAALATEIPRQRHLRDRLESGLRGLGAVIFGAAAERLANTSFFAFDGIDGETLVGRLDRAGFACASGSACSSAVSAPSATLAAMGVAPERAKGALRVSLGAATQDQSVRRFLAAVEHVVTELRSLRAVAA